MAFEDQTVLVIIRRADNAVTGNFRLGKNTHVTDFWWVNPERVLISIAEKLDWLEQPQLTGELNAINADGTKTEFLVGQRRRTEAARSSGKKAEMVAAFLVDGLPDDDKNVIISVRPLNADPSPIIPAAIAQRHPSQRARRCGCSLAVSCPRVVIAG